jgi:uncharacterized phage protein gp47/JayE
MPSFGLNPTGFKTKSSSEYLAGMQNSVRQALGEDLLLTEDEVEGNILQIVCDQLGIASDELGKTHDAFNPDNAVDAALDSVGLLRGVLRKSSQQGVVATIVNLSASFSAAAGAMVAYVAGQPDNRWVNRDAVTSTTAGGYVAIFVSESTGAAFQISSPGVLTVIAQPVVGWNSITNTDAAQNGTDVETDPAYRARQEEQLTTVGSHTTASIEADLEAVDGVVEANVLENTSDVYDAGIPPHGVRAIIWDGTWNGVAVVYGADANEVAAAVDVAAGIPTSGVLNGTFLDSEGVSQIRLFDRAEEHPVDIALEVTTDTPPITAEQQEAFELFYTTYIMALGVGEDVVWSRVLCEVQDWITEQNFDWEVATLSLDGGLVVADALGESIPILEDEHATPGNMDVDEL